MRGRGSQRPGQAGVLHRTPDLDVPGLCELCPAWLLHRLALGTHDRLRLLVPESRSGDHGGTATGPVVPRPAGVRGRAHGHGLFRLYGRSTRIGSPGRRPDQEGRCRLAVTARGELAGAACGDGDLGWVKVVWRRCLVPLHHTNLAGMRPRALTVIPWPFAVT